MLSPPEAVTTAVCLCEGPETGHGHCHGQLGCAGVGDDRSEFSAQGSSRCRASSACSSEPITTHPMTIGKQATQDAREECARRWMRAGVSVGSQSARRSSDGTSPMSTGGGHERPGRTPFDAEKSSSHPVGERGDCGADEPVDSPGWKQQPGDPGPQPDNRYSNGNGKRRRGGNKFTKLLTSSEFMERWQPPDYTIDGLLMKGSVYTLTGNTNHGKTTLALRMAHAVATGGGLAGRLSQQGARWRFLPVRTPTTSAFSGSHFASILASIRPHS